MLIVTMLISVYVYMNMRITMVMLLRHTGHVSIQQRGSRSSRKSAHVRRNVCATQVRYWSLTSLNITQMISDNLRNTATVVHCIGCASAN